METYDKSIRTDEDVIYETNVLNMICQHLNYDLVYGIIDDIEDADDVFCPSQSFDVKKYFNKRFLFGPHLSIFPDDKTQRIHSQDIPTLLSYV